MHQDFQFLAHKSIFCPKLPSLGEGQQREVSHTFKSIFPNFVLIRLSEISKWAHAVCNALLVLALTQTHRKGGEEEDAKDTEINQIN